MSYDRPVYRKPPYGTPLVASSLRAGLMGFYALNELGGPVVHDAARNLDLTIQGFGSNKPWGSSNAGTGLVTRGINNAGAQATLPSRLQAGWPITLACAVRPGGAASANGRFIALMPSNSNVSPFTVAELYANGTTLSLGIQAGGVFYNLANHPYTAGADAVFAATITPTTWALYINGASVASGTATGAGAGPTFAAPTYTAAAQLVLAGWSAQGGADCGPLYWGGWWAGAGGAMPAALHAEIGSDVNAIWPRLYRNRVKAALATASTGITSVTPSSIFAGRSTVVAVTGFQTTWTGSPFSLVGAPAGTSITPPQTINSTTSATLTIQAGSTTGSFQLSDGTHTHAMSVVSPSIAVSPARIPSGHAGNITLTLTGAGTNFTSGSAVSVQNSVTGTTTVAKAAGSPWTAIDATHATLLVTTGSGTGTATITVDGVVSPALSVAPATLVVAPTDVASKGTYALNLSDDNTLWTQSSPTGLFTTGYAGATISNIAVQADARATATLSLNGAGGTLTVTDTSTGATDNLTVHAVPSGSLHVAGPLLLQSATSAFGNQANAYFAFRFKANSNAGLNLGSGTAVLSFAGSTPNGSIPVSYRPATRQLVFVLYGTGGTSAFSAAVPIQVGTDYHFLAACAGGAWTLYCNGLAYATGTAGTGTYAYGALQVGGFAGNDLGGNPQAMDHTVADVSAGNGYVPTPSEALSLAKGDISPLQLATPALSWWPLGGGTTGAHPVDADRTTAWGWLADWTGNGATLSVAPTTPAGALTNATYAAAIPITSPIRVDAIVEKTGHLLCFHASGSGQINGVYPPAAISAINADPTVKRMGTAVQVGPRIWFPTKADSPDLFYELQCGGVQAIAIEDGGATATTDPAAVAITPDNTGTGGSGLTLGTPVLKAGVTGYTPTNSGGAGYRKPPVLTISDPGNPTPGTGALGYCVIGPDGRCDGVRITDGGTGYANPTGTISGGDINPSYGVAGTGAKVQLFQVGGVVQDNAVMLDFGGNPSPITGQVPYCAPPAVTVSNPPSMGGPLGNKAAFARANVYGADAANWGGTPGAIREVVPLMGGVGGCGTGYTTATVTVGAPPAGGTTATYTAVVSNYIADVPVTSPGQDYARPPKFTIADAGATRAAALQPMMTGAFATTLSGTTTAGSASVTGLPSTSTLRVGHSASGTGVPAGATIQAINGPNSITLSAVATASGTPSLRFADAFTYDAPASWLTANIGGTGVIGGAWTQGKPVGGLQAVAGAAVANQAGQVETAVGGLLGFADTPTMLAGANLGAQPVNPSAISFPFKNRLHAARPGVLRGTGTILLSADETPVSWTPSCVVGWQAATSTGSNALDNTGDPQPYGTWTACYDDPHANTIDAAAVCLSTFNDAGNLTITPVMLSGPGAPIAIPAGNITVNGLGAVTAISLAGLTLGAGWQGGAVRIVGGFGAAANVIVAGGVPTAINVIAGGTGYSPGGATATLYGTLVSGGTVTQQVNYAFLSNPSEWATSVTFEVAQRSGLWTLSNPWLVAPDVRTRGGAAIPFDRSNPWAVDDGLLAMWTTPTGRAIGCLRPMDALGTFGGYTNYVHEWDIVPDGSQLNWFTAKTRTVNFAFARALNTDPNSTAYPWSSTKVYAPQAWGVQGPDAPFTVTGTLTSGSTQVTGVSNMGLLVGSAISGTGIPAGAKIAATCEYFTATSTGGSKVLAVNGDTSRLAAGMAVACQFLPVGATIASVDGPSQVTLSANALSSGFQRITATGTTITLSAPATASGTQTLTVTTPGYIALAPSDMGNFMAGSNGFGAIELRSTVPHGLSTGYNPNIIGTTPLSFPGGTSYNPGGAIAATNLTTPWVTGPYTIAYFVGGLAPSGTGIQPVNSATEVPVNYQLILGTPPTPNCLSPSAVAELCRQVGCPLWFILPQGATDACIQALAGLLAAHLGPSLALHEELGNELFTFGNMSGYFGPLQDLLVSLPADTSVLGGTPATVAGLGAKGSFNLCAGHAMDVFATAWTAAGQDAARLRRHTSGQFAVPGFALDGLKAAQRAGRRVDHIHGAPYVSLPSDTPITQAIAPAGSAFAAAGSLPVDAINALLSYYIHYSGSYWQEWAAEAAQCRAFGQPIEQVQVASVVAGGSSIGGATYYWYYTFADESGGYGVGNETTIGLSQNGPTVVGSGSTVSLTMPCWPPWAQALNWYVGPNTAPGVCTFYQQVTRAQYASTYPPGTPYPLTIAVPAGWSPPPSSNGVPSGTSGVAATPTMTMYEGSIQNPVQPLVPGYLGLLHDTFLHPSSADAFRNFQLFEQRGNPMVSGSGAVLACYFEASNLTQYPNMWFIEKGTAQMPGDGLGHAYATNQTYTVAPNRFATIQGGYSSDGVAPDWHDHFHAGVSPMLQGWRSWSDVASPAPATPSPTPTTPTITWPTPDPISYGTALSGTQLDATASSGGSAVDGVFAYSPAVGAILPAGTATLNTTFTPTDTADFTGASASVLLTVNQAVPALSWPAPTPISLGTPLSAAQLDATAGIPGTFVYSPAFGAVLPLGTSTLSTTFTPADSANYTTATASTTINVISSPTPTPTATEYAFTDPDAARVVSLPAGMVVGLAYTDPDAARVISPT